MIKTLIVDDEPLAGEILETYIAQLPNVELVGRCYNAIEANDFLNSTDVYWKLKCRNLMALILQKI